MRREQAATNKTKKKAGNVKSNSERKKPVKKLVTGTTEIFDFDLEAEEKKPKGTGKKKSSAGRPRSLEENRAPEKSKTASDVNGGRGPKKQDDSYLDFVPKKKALAAKKREARQEEAKSAGKGVPAKAASGRKTASRPSVTAKDNARKKTADRTGSKKKKGGFFEDFSAMDVVIALTGVLVLLAAVGTIGVYSSARTVRKQVEAMAAVGEKMEEIGIAGEGIFTAVADAKIAGMEAAELPVEEESSGEYEEKELTTEMNVGLKLTSVQRDLKIKFTNKKSGKLIGNQAFSVDIAGPENKTLADDDKDGIIYIKDITPGEYSVTVTGPEQIDGNTVAGVKGIVTVKDKIEYKKIDVTDEVKKESEINTAKEDTAVANQVESVLTDTVEWVESTKTPLEEGGSESYEEIKKGDIPDPSVSVMLDRIWTADTQNGSYLSQNTVKLAENAASFSKGSVRKLEKGAWFTENETTAAPRETESAAPAESTSPADPTEPSEEPKPSEPEPPKAEVSGISVSADAGRTEVGKSVAIKAAVSMSDGSSYGGSVEWSSDKGGQLSGSGTSVTLTDSSVETVTVYAKAGDREGSVTVEFYAPDKKVTSIKIPDSVSAVTGGTAGLSLDVQPGDAKDKRVEWKITEGSEFASVDGNGTVKGLKAGTAKVQAAAADGSMITSNTCTVTVSADIGVSLEAPGEMTVGEEKQLKCSTSGEVDSVRWSTSDAKIAVIDEKNGKVISLSAGKVTVTVKVKGKNGKEVSAAGELKVNAAGVDQIKLDPSSVTIRAGDKKTIKASVSTKGNKAVEWKSKDESIVKIVESKDDSCVVQGIKPGKASIVAASKENKDKTAECQITVELQDSSARLKDKNGNQLYYKDGDEYKEATVADYYEHDVFYRKKDTAKYRYTGWQTIDGKRYYFDKNGNPVTGDQIIQGIIRSTVTAACR